MVVVDTSVWVDYLRGITPSISRALDELIDDDVVAILPPIRLELILGCKKSQRASLMKRIDVIHILSITEATWTLAEELCWNLRSSGITPGTVDILIAAAASEHNALLWTLDKDFEPLFKQKVINPFVH